MFKANKAMNDHEEGVDHLVSKTKGMHALGIRQCERRRLSPRA